MSMYNLQRVKPKKPKLGLIATFNAMFFPLVIVLVLIAIALIIANIRIRQGNVLGFFLLAIPPVLAASAIWGVGKKSTACGVTLGLLFVIGILVIAVLFIIPQWRWLFI